jgi:cysteinyl-tRNA synthetase
MEIKLWNTLKFEKEILKPIKKGEVRIYHCGPTVYNRAHVGNLRAYIFADILRRTCEINDLAVRQVINITDVGHLTSDEDEGEDKIEKSAKEQNKTATEIADEYTKLFLQDLEKLNIRTLGTQFPKASEHIKEQILLIQKLEKKGFTYQTSDGIYFDTSKYKDYGKLGNINTKGLEEGARVEANPEKKNITDFALWKFSPTNQKRQQEWDSPWGIGFPGWHIECSAMSEKYLDQPFDIHTGGVDHIPVHHNNEIAQSECANDLPLANIWMHSAHILVDNSKMSKSIGNVYSLDDLQEKNISAMAYRYWLLTVHYKTQSNLTFETLRSSQTALQRLYSRVSLLPETGEIDEKAVVNFINFVNDDLNTPQAVAYMWDYLKDPRYINTHRATLLEFDRVLGLGIRGRLIESLPKEINELLLQREMARESNNWTLSDEIRNKITEMGYNLQDTDAGQIVSKKV